MDKQTPEQIMTAYREAYQSANGKSVQIDYFRGWYAVYTGGGFQSRHRAREIADLTTRLRYRASQVQS